MRGFLEGEDSALGGALKRGLELGGWPEGVCVIEYKFPLLRRGSLINKIGEWAIESSSPYCRINDECEPNSRVLQISSMNNDATGCPCGLTEL